MVKGLKEKDLTEQLKDFFRGKVAILGIGNSMRGDDCCGAELAKRINGKVAAEVFECGATPENFVDPLINSRPDAILVIDSYDLQKSPGTIKLFQSSSLNNLDFSTDTHSSQIFVDFLYRKSQANVAFLVIQPSRNKLNLEMSKEVQEAVSKLEEIVLKIFSRK